MLPSFLLPPRSTPREHWPSMLNALEASWAPFIKDRGLDWEMHVEQHERELWRVQGLDAPLPDAEEEREWVRQNRAIPFK